ncbi:cytochrome P450 oxidoreductase [Mycena pura]|uniref:Cytochrome P450 oxidoreductase n=1 Tax=Mycena pura TaxID=153505 RepID=A0AAD6VUL0_9AGAR|nr:cytochrome P450 oxidoreductase [Mycena pura]
MIILSIPTLAVISYALYNLFFHPLSGIPGPIGARTGLLSWKSARAVKLDMGWKVLELHEKYGKVVRIARNEASICDPDAISQIYRYIMSSEAKKLTAYNAGGVDGPTSISTVDNKRHAEMRRAESPAYATKLFAAFEERVDASCRELMGLLDRCIDAGKGSATVDMGEILQLFAIDVVGELSLSKSFGLCDEGRDTHKILPMLVKFLEIACIGAFSPPLVAVLTCFNDLICSRNAAYLGTIRGRIDSRFSEHRKLNSTYTGHRDMLEAILAAQNPDGSEYSLNQARAAVGLILGAGSGKIFPFMTAQTMRAMLRFIVGHPRVHAKVLQEFDSALKCSDLSIPLSYAEACKLSYFQACLKETLRLHPPIPWTLSRIVDADGARIAGHFFPAGTEVSMSPFVLHRRAEAYGADADTFCPERWLEAEADPARRREMEHNNLAFGSGPRVCAGRSIGMMEVSKVMPLLFSKYKMRFTPRSATSPHTRIAGRGVDGRMSMEEPYFVTSQWTAMQSDFWCDLSRRAYSAEAVEEQNIF